MDVVMNVSDQIVVLDHGQKISSGSPKVVSEDPKVINPYLGEPGEDPLPPEMAGRR